VDRHPEIARALTRLVLWLMVAIPVIYAALWALERLIIGGILGPNVLSEWFSVAGLLLAVAAGNVVAYGFDRVYMERLVRDRPSSSSRG
jgi:hypothetical protein